MKPIYYDSLDQWIAGWQQDAMKAVEPPYAVIRLDTPTPDNPDMTPVRCTDCGWSGRGFQLVAQACPVCDGRVGEES